MNTISVGLYLQFRLHRYRVRIFEFGCVVASRSISTESVSVEQVNVVYVCFGPSFRPWWDAYGGYRHRIFQLSARRQWYWRWQSLQLHRLTWELADTSR